MAGNWFDPNAFMTYGGRLLKGFRGNIDDVLGYAKDTADIYRLNKIFGDPMTKIDMAKKAMDIATENAKNAKAKAQQKVNEYLSKQAKIQAQEDKAQVGRAKSVGTKGTYPKAVKMSTLNQVNPKAVEQALNTPGKSVNPVLNRLATPEQLDELANLESKISGAVGEITQDMAKANNPMSKVKTFTKGLWGGLASPLGVAGLASLPYLWETGRNWNAPGSDWQSRALDTTGSVFTGATTGIGAGLGSLIPHPWAPVAGGVTGALVGGAFASPAFKRAQEERDANRDFDTTYTTEDQFVRNALEGRFNLPSNIKTEADIRDFYRQTMNKAKTNETIANGIDDVSADDWLAEIIKQGKEIYGIDDNYSSQTTPGGSKPITDLEPIEGATTKGNTSLGINYPGQYLTSLNGASKGYDRVPSSVELLATLWGYNNQPQNQTAQPSVDNRDFTQRVYDGVDKLRQNELEGKPNLRPKSDVEETQSTTPTTPTANDVLLQGLSELRQSIDKSILKDPSSKWDAIRRANFASSIGLTPYQIWGDYPNGKDNLKNLASLIKTEYDIRKDIEDRQKLQEYQNKVLLNYSDDPEMQMIASDPELYKAYIPYSGIKDRRNYDIDMKKKEYDRNTNLIQEIIKGNNDAYKEQVKADLGIRDIDAKTIGDILTNRDKASTLDLNKQYQYDTLERIADQRNRMSGYNNLIDNQVKLRIAEIGAQSKNPQLNALAQMVSSGAIQDDATVMAIYNALAQEAGLDTTGVNGGIGSLFSD